MKILFFGRGVIATEYAWALEKAGHTVEFYVRKGKAAQYGKSVKLDFIDGRNKTKVQGNWSVILHKNLDIDNNYDLIIVSVNHYQLDSVVEFLAPRIGKATILFFNNFWSEPLETIAPLPAKQVVWGFPNAGGGFYSDGTLRGGIMKTITLGKIDNLSDEERYKDVYDLFKNAGFSVSQNRDFRSWLQLKFVMSTAVEAMTVKAGSHANLFDSPKYTKEAAMLIKEMLPLLKTKGDKINLTAKVFFYLPAGLIGFILRKATSKGSLGRSFLEHSEITGHISQNANNTFSKDVIKEAQELGISLPKLEAIWEN